jgi:glycosyltransferase involved in cell wall biosynthesis
MNILYLSEPDPRMTHFGGAQRTNAIWRALQELGDVYTMTFDQRFETQEVAPRLWYVKKLQKVNAIRDLLYKVQTFIWRKLRVLYCFPLATKIEKTADEIFPNIKFDVVVCRYLDVLGEMHLWGHPRLIVDIDDDPLQMYDTVKSQEVRSWLRPLGRWILQKQVNYLQSKICDAWVSNSNIVSLEESKTKIVHLKNIARCPSAHYSTDAVRKLYLLAVGALDYRPNFMGIDTFLSNIWPSVHTVFPDLRLAIVGKNAPTEFVERWKHCPNVDLKGFVEDIEKVYEHCLCSVVPVNEGGGTCIKTLEALAFSRVCLATPFGARGVEPSTANRQTGLFVYTDAPQFVGLLQHHVMNAEHREKNEKAANLYVSQNNSYEAFAKTVAETIKSVWK